MAQEKRKKIPLVIEPHPTDYVGYPFVTLIQYRNEYFLTIVDNATDKTIDAFVLDFCLQEHVSEQDIVEHASQWFECCQLQCPVSFYFSKVGVIDDASRIFKSFNTDYITRIVGPVSHFDMTKIHKIKRRKRKDVPKGVEIKKKAAF